MASQTHSYYILISKLADGTVEVHVKNKRRLAKKHGGFGDKMAIYEGASINAFNRKIRSEKEGIFGALEKKFGLPESKDSRGLARYGFL